MNMNKYLDVNPEVAAAIAAGKPVEIGRASCRERV